MLLPAEASFEDVVVAPCLRAVVAAAHEQGSQAVVELTQSVVVESPAELHAAVPHAAEANAAAAFVVGTF